MTTPNLADALQGLSDAGWRVTIHESYQGEYCVAVDRKYVSDPGNEHGELFGPDPAQLVLDLWAEVSGGKEGT